MYLFPCLPQILISLNLHENVRGGQKTPSVCPNRNNSADSNRCLVDKLHTADLYHIFNGPLLARRGRKTKGPAQLEHSKSSWSSKFLIRIDPRKLGNSQAPPQLRNHSPNSKPHDSDRQSTSSRQRQEKKKSNNSNKLLCSPSCEVLIV